MSESTPADQTTDPTPAEGDGDELREHPQEPAEGPTDEPDERGDVPRVHSEDPAEG
jgi:hypothetical protein